MKAGQLDRRVTIQRKTVTISDSGDTIETWANLSVRRPASMWPVRGDERFASPQEVASDQIEFRIRYSADVAALTPLDRIIHPALDADEDPDDAPVRYIHDILLVQEIGRREGLKVITLRRADVLVVDPTPPGDGPAMIFSLPANSGLLAVLEF